MLKVSEKSEAEGAEATALEKSFEDAASNSNKVDNGDGDEVPCQCVHEIESTNTK